MSLQRIKLKPLFYLKSKNSSPITCEQTMIGEMEKEKNTRASKEEL